MEKQVIHFNEDTFKEALQSDKVVLVDFFATWCGPCKMLAPIIEEVRKEVGEEFIIGKVDVDECFDIARTYGIMSVPTLIIFEKGEEQERIVGLKPKSAIVGILNNNK